MIKKRPEKLSNVLEKIKECIGKGLYRHTNHAFDRQNERIITLPMILHVLKTGREEKRKTSFSEDYHTWKYAIRGKTVDDFDLRIIVSFDQNNMLIITVMHVGDI